MKNKYIKFFKKELVFLLILLLVVCFSFGVTYANFEVKSDNYRAVEMFASKLSHNIIIDNQINNRYTVKPGNSIINVEIRSLNNVDTFYKLLTNTDLKVYVISDSASGVLKKNDYVYIKLYIVNPSDEYIDIAFDVSEGYITNKLEDVIITEGYHEIKDTLNVGDTVIYDDKNYILLEINDNAEAVLLSTEKKNVVLSGYNGYNDMNGYLDNICGERSVSLEDIMKYTNTTYIKEDELYTRIEGINFYPIVFNSEDVIIDNPNEDNGYGYSYGINLRNREIVNSDLSNTLFGSEEYLLNTRYYIINNNHIEFYILGVKNGTLIKKKLYDSTNNNYEVTSSIKCIKTVQNEEISK